MSKKPSVDDEGKPKKPYMVFTPDGYVWGPGHPDESKRGQRPYWDGAPPSWARAALATYEEG